MHSLISSDNTLLIWAVLIIYVFLAMYAERHWKWAQAVGAALICLVGGMLLSSLGLMPSTSGAYDVIWSMVTPLAIPLVLFAADLKKIIKESGKMLIMFLITCCGTMLGAIVAAVIFHGKIAEVWKPAAMFTGSQTGGSMNVVVMADVWDITGSTFDAIYVADIITFTFTLFTLVMLPSVAILRKKYKCMYDSPIVHTSTEENGTAETSLTVFSIAKALATLLRANKAVFKELWCNPDKRVTPFSLFKRISPLFSVLLFPLCQQAAVLSECQTIRPL